MSAVEYISPEKTISSQSAPHIIVIGAGPVGIRFVNDFFYKNATCHMTLFGNEPYEPYNRVQLSHVLSRSKDYGEVTSALPISSDEKQFSFVQAHISHIDPEQKIITTRTGETFYYDKLVLATGSSPHIPNIEGIDLEGVYTFRNLKDTEALLARRHRSRRTVVMGGGLLGLEAAKALSCDNTEVFLVQQSDRLMNRQLDEKAGKKLQTYVESLGINVITQSGVRQIVGDLTSTLQQEDQEPSMTLPIKQYGRVTGVMTRDKEFIECDTVVLCTGIKPNIQLAVDAGAAFAQGILVNDLMETSIPEVYAIGECCEHKGQVYGMVAPGLEQATVLVDRLSGGHASYQGTQLISTLKVVGESVTSMGEVAEVTQRLHQQELSFNRKKSAQYRKAIFHRGHLIGACSIGEWPESRRIQEAFLSNQYFYPWQRWYFQLTGKLWFSDEKQSVADWPEMAMICQCNQISRGSLSSAIEGGCRSVSDLGKQTGAGTVCGSCQPLLQNLLGTDEKPEPVKGGIPVVIFSFLAAIVGLFLFFFPGIEAETSVQTPSIEFLWVDGFWKQVSGFSLLGLVVIGLLMSFRKRAQWKFLGNFSYWRVLHTILGAIALAVLFLHTGAHLGENLNKWLMVNFLVVALVGALAGFLLHLASTTSASTMQTLKTGIFWVHILVVWPLPALLVAHIMSVYYF